MPGLGRKGWVDVFHLPFSFFKEKNHERAILSYGVHLAVSGLHRVIKQA